MARLALALAPHARRILVFAGPGNNGGDGIEAATRLCGWGKPTTVLRVGLAATLPPDASQALARARDAGVDIREFDAGETIDGDPPDLVIDALLGIGASRAPEGAIAAAIGRIAALAALGARVLAIDVPSGLDVDRGQPLGNVVRPRGRHAHPDRAEARSLHRQRPRPRRTNVVRAALGVAPADGRADAWLVGTSDPACAVAPRRHAATRAASAMSPSSGARQAWPERRSLAARAAHAAGAGRVLSTWSGARGRTKRPLSSIRSAPS